MAGRSIDPYQRTQYDAAKRSIWHLYEQGFLNENDATARLLVVDRMARLGSKPSDWQQSLTMLAPPEDVQEQPSPRRRPNRAGVHHAA